MNAIRHFRNATWLCTCLMLLLAASTGRAGLVGSWNQDELSGNIIDSTAGHPAGVPTGPIAYGLPGVPNGTYGSITVTNAGGTSIGYGPSTIDSYFSVGSDNNNPALNINNNGALTIMGWVNPSAPVISASTYRFFSTGSAGGADRGWGIGLRLNGFTGAGSAIRFTTYGIADNDSSTFPVTFGEWVHVAATYNNGAINYYLNGNPLDSDASVFGNESAAGRLVIGGRFGGNDTDQMGGIVDGIQLFDHVLTPLEIQQAASASVTAAIPEPSTIVLTTVGVAFLVWRKRRSILNASAC
jgi:hypothetical protein